MWIPEMGKSTGCPDCPVHGELTRHMSFACNGGGVTLAFQKAPRIAFLEGFDQVTVVLRRLNAVIMELSHVNATGNDRTATCPWSWSHFFDESDAGRWLKRDGRTRRVATAAGGKKAPTAHVGTMMTELPGAYCTAFCKLSRVVSLRLRDAEAENPSQRFGPGDHKRPAIHASQDAPQL